jgi:hypothetical protein
MPPAKKKAQSAAILADTEDQTYSAKGSDPTESEDDLTIADPNMLGQAVVFGTDWTAATLIDQLRRGNIKLDPIFQRRDAWDAERKSRFIESLVIGLPIPQVVLAEDKADRGSFLVIDGKQRLLSLQQFAGITTDANQGGMVLTGLKLRRELNGKTYQDLRTDSKLRNHLNAFDNQPVRTVVVRNWQTEDVLYLIFHRLNSETLPLSPQELRQALHPGPFLRYAAEYTMTTGGIHRALGIKKPDFRMRDVELFVRYSAFQNYLSDYSGNLKKFLDDTCKSLNDSWATIEPTIKKQSEDLEAAISLSYDIFGQNAFRKRDGTGYETRFNRAIFDIIVYYFSREAIREKANSKKAKVKTAFEVISADVAFLRSIELTTKSIQATSTRFRMWGQQLSKALATKITLPQIGAQ